MMNVTEKEIHLKKSSSTGFYEFSSSELPTLLVRVKALFIDILLILVILSSLSVLITLLSVDLPGYIRGAIAFFIFILYDPLFTARYGGTIGHRLMGLRVKQYLNVEKNLNFPNAVLRSLTKVGLGWISFLSITATSHKRAIHDILSGSITLR